jgi:type II secretory pathway pseudopilin PulG
VKRIMILAVVAVMLAVAAAPAMAQNDKAAQRAANKAAKQEQRAQNRAAKGGGVQKAAPAPEVVPDGAFAQKALPSSGGMPAGKVALLGTGVLLVGGGVVALRITRR